MAAIYCSMHATLWICNYVTVLVEKEPTAKNMINKAQASTDIRDRDYQNNVLYSIIFLVFQNYQNTGYL